MATITTAMKLQDRFTAIIENSIGVMGRMVDTMEEINRAEGNLDLSDEFAGMRKDISLAGHALDQFNQELEESSRHEQTVNRLSGGFGGLSKAIIVANQGLELSRKGLQALDGLGTASDARAGADARLGLINDGLRTQEQLEAQVMAVANQTRSEYESTAELVARMGRQDYFKGNNDMALAFAETLNKGLIVSGASAQEANSALIQLSQGIASGVLRGEEFNSIMENGSVLAEMMAESLGVNKGELRQMAQEGQLTADVVVSSIMEQAGAIDKQFAQMPVTYGQVQNQFHNISSRVLDSLLQPGMGVDRMVSKLEQLSNWLTTADGSQFLTGLTAAVSAAVEVVLFLGDAAASVYTNASWLGPVFVAAAAALAGYIAVQKGYNAVLAIQAGLEKWAAFQKTAHAAAQAMSTGSTFAATAAQYGLNAALYACPLTWIVLMIIAFVAAIYAAVGAVNHFAGTSISATGLIAGAFTALGAHLLNTFVLPAWNSFAMLGNFFGNVFNDPAAAVQVLFYDMCMAVLGYIRNLASAIETLLNKIPGVSVEITSGLDSFYAGLEEAQQAVKDESGWTEYFKKMDYIDLADAAGAGYRFGESAADRLSFMEDAAETFGGERNYDFSNTQFPKMALAGGTKVGIEEESLEYLNDLAEMRSLQSIEDGAGLHLTPGDAALLRSSSGQQNNIFYINHRGGVKNDVTSRQGADWPTIRREMEAESQNQINTGLDELEEVIFTDG